MVIKKIGITLFSVFVFLVSVEILLYLTGLYFYRQNFIHNAAQISTDELVVITLGESTTADITQGLSWPRHLQALFDQHNMKIQVINLAEPGTDSALQLIAYKKQIQINPHHLVISMMGVNDLGRNLFYKQSEFYEFRILKFIKYFYRNYALPQESYQQVLKPALGLSFNQKQIKKLDEVAEKIKKENHIDDKIIALFLKENSDISENQVLLYLADKFKGPWGQAPENYKLSYEFYDRYMKKYLDQSRLLEYLALSSQLKQAGSCDDIAHKLLLQKDFDDAILQALINCLPVDNENLRKLISSKNAQLELNPTANGFEVFKKNMSQLVELVRDNQNCILVMQYPNLSVAEMQAALSDYQKIPQIYFLENKNNFELALQKYRYEDLFYDKFASTFGHTTDLGSQLIAENVFQQIQQFINHKQCGFENLKTK